MLCPHCGADKPPIERKQVAGWANLPAIVIGGLIPFGLCLVGVRDTGSLLLIASISAPLVAAGLLITWLGYRTVFRCRVCRKRLHPDD